MDFETMRMFFALAALVANVVTIGLIIVILVTRGREDNPLAALSDVTLWLAGGVAIVATLGSLYLSESVGLVPCKLCWYQRIAMYPLAVILPIAAFRKDHKARLYAVVLSGVGAVVAIYHRVLQAYPSLDTGSCSAAGPSCSSPLIKMFGFVTIPYMALSAFALILVLLWVDRINNARSVPTSHPDVPNTSPNLDQE
ncbi:MAG: disulfide bond formation protein B [Acidimicrobiia bacterium]